MAALRLQPRLAGVTLIQCAIQINVTVVVHHLHIVSIIEIAHAVPQCQIFIANKVAALGKRYILSQSLFWL